MPDIFLKPGASSPSDVTLGDPTSGVIGIPIKMGGAPPRINRVYYQARCEPLYVAPPIVQVIVPFGWYSGLSCAPPIVKAQAGFSFVPFDTAQLSVNYTDFSWYQPLAGAPHVAKAQPGFVSTLNTSQQVVGVTWQSPLSVAPAVAKARFEAPYPVQVARVVVTGIPLDMGGMLPQIRTTYVQALSAPVPFNTPQRFAYTNLGWYQQLAVPAKVAVPQMGMNFVPFSTTQVTPAVSGTDRIVKFIGNVGHMMLR